MTSPSNSSSLEHEGVDSALRDSVLVSEVRRIIAELREQSLHAGQKKPDLVPAEELDELDN